MKTFKCEPTSTAQWYSLVQDATLLAGYQIDETVENYLVMTLEKNIGNNSIGSCILALDFLNSSELNTKSDANSSLRL